MPKFEVAVVYRVKVTYLIDADDEAKAEREADARFHRSEPSDRPDRDWVKLDYISFPLAVP